MISATRLLAAVFALTLLAAQQAPAQTNLPGHLYTGTGIDLGAPDWRDIPESESAVRFTDPQDVKSRKAAKFQDRYAENITLRNNGLLAYRRLFGRASSFGTSGIEQAAVWLRQEVEKDFYAQRGIKYDERQVKRAGELAYFVQSSATATCFLFNALLGDGLRRDQDIGGNVCFDPKLRTAAALEQEMLSILSRARFGAPSDKNSFTVSFQIPDSLITSQR
jgi:hypothetical protein